MEFAPHFPRRELTITNTGLPNEPTSNNLSRLISLSWKLEYIRNTLGVKPLYINSAYRSYEVNKAVGGAKNSFHLSGCAADISIMNLTLEERRRLKEIIISHYPSEFIIYDTFYHVAFDFSRLGNTKPMMTFEEEYPDVYPTASPVNASESEFSDY